MTYEFPKETLARLRESQVVAGFSVEDVAHAVPVAEALLAGGIDAIELTLRTPVAVDAIRAIYAEVPDMLLGVGTLLTPEQAAEAKAAGADFGVAPGLNSRVVSEAGAIGLPFAPGIATPSELESAIELGCRLVKFFPAEAAGGIPYLHSMGAPYKHLGIQYFPLGGLNAENMLDYLREPNVPAIGGSWIVNESLVENRDWAGIASRAAEVRSILAESKPRQGESIRELL
jgi:2-dehydro-3-deoxyphosphogluconate aldolase/(4S)-4-hydroxy-2-oxoglutarate aldolase